MTTEEQDALVGRVLRESKEAEATLSTLLVRAEQIAKDLSQLQSDIHARVRRAKDVGVQRAIHGGRMVLDPHAADAGFEIGHLSKYKAATDIEALAELDREIGQAVARAVDLRGQKQRLGL